MRIRLRIKPKLKGLSKCCICPPASLLALPHFVPPTSQSSAHWFWPYAQLRPRRRQSSSPARTAARRLRSTGTGLPLSILISPACSALSPGESQWLFSQSEPQPRRYIPYRIRLLQGAHVEGAGRLEHATRVAFFL